MAICLFSAPSPRWQHLTGKCFVRGGIEGRCLGVGRPIWNRILEMVAIARLPQTDPPGLSYNLVRESESPSRRAFQNMATNNVASRALANSGHCDVLFQRHKNKRNVTVKYRAFIISQQTWRCWTGS